MNFMILAAESISWSDRLNYIGVGTLLGIGVVFAVLIQLWLILELFHVCMSKVTGKEKETKAVETPAPAPVVSAPALAPAPVAEATDDGELIAAITAALVIYLEGEVAVAGPAAPASQFASGFRVVSFKKVGNAAHWNQN